MVSIPKTQRFIIRIPNRLLGEVTTSVSGSDEFVSYLVNVARKWSRVWEERRVYEANPKEGIPKYFLTAAFMYPNGPAHVGHARTYLIPDVLARFLRGLGYNVLFPMGFHYTGTPILALAEGLATGNSQYVSSVAEVFRSMPQSSLSLRIPCPWLGSSTRYLRTR